jgi:hypothetical protein
MILAQFLKEHNRVEHSGDVNCPICQIKLKQSEMIDHMQAHEFAESDKANVLRPTSLNNYRPWD